MLFRHPNYFTNVKARECCLYRSLSIGQATAPKLSVARRCIRNLTLQSSALAQCTRKTNIISHKERTQQTEACTGCLFTVEVEVGFDGTVEKLRD